MSAIDISMIAVFGREGAFAIPAIASLADMARLARAQGLAVELILVLDQADALTGRIVRGCADAVQLEVDHDDLGLARNAGIAQARGEYAAVFDGGDLWGAEWLLRAHQAACGHPAEKEAVWHPELIASFDEGDFVFASFGENAHPLARSHFLRGESSDVAAFDPMVLRLENLWSPVVFGARQTLLRHPYPAESPGFEATDWSWNLLTLARACAHLVVPGTVHMRRWPLYEGGPSANNSLPLIP